MSPTTRSAARVAIAFCAAVASGVVVYGYASDAGANIDYVHYLVHPLGRIALATLIPAFTCGFAPVRLLLPQRLRRYELLWYVPAGMCVMAVGLTACGYLGFAFHVSLAVVLTTAAAAGVLALKRRPFRRRSRVARDAARAGGHSGAGADSGARAGGVIAWAAYSAALIAIVALVPMMRGDYLTVLGEGSDAHLAVGTAQFLQHHYPTSIHTDVPVNRVPLVWKSKVPIYYSLGASSTLSGLEPYETIAAVQAILIALAALGFFLLARELLEAPPWAAIAGMLLVGADRMVLHTALHPYYNQTWGLMVLPYIVIIGWAAAGDPEVGSRGGALGLLALFAGLEAFAYPLALPLPLVGIAVFALARGRSRRGAGAQAGPRAPSAARRSPAHRLLRRRHTAFLILAVLALLVPLVGVSEKLKTGSLVAFNPFASLMTWGGDLGGYFPEQQFLSLGSGALLIAATPALLAAGYLALRRLPRALALGIAAMLAFALLGAISFRLRHYGYYFHFKLLAFAGPLAVVTAAAGLSRIPRLGWIAVAAYLVAAQSGPADELAITSNQLPPSVLALRDVDRELPDSASIRLDLNPGAQLWPAYLLYHHPLCSELPLLETSYPHVVDSRKADYIVVNHGMRPPADAVPGPPAMYAGQFLVYKARGDIPGPSYCSRRRAQTYTTASS